MGDVAMSAAVVREFTLQNQNTKVIVVSRAIFAPFFADIENIIFHSFDPQNKHKGVKGLFKLFNELKAYKPTAVADLHNNLRSRILSSFFRISSIPIARLDKNRTKKKALTAKRNKVLIPLRPMTEAYADVFIKLGFTLLLSHQLRKNKKELPSKYSSFFINSQQKKIGISPFAQHATKVYPLAKMEQVIQVLANEGKQLFIFGGGKEEKALAEGWEKRFPNVESIIGKLTLQEELDLISCLDLMISMDSAGMHLASLMGVKVVSIWGATHPYAGFLGYGQQKQNCIQIDLYCRPCSIYGNKPCYRGDLACMHSINSAIVIAQVKEALDHD
jgi:ADP-heptose:LPS heptosyltransferase